MLEVTVKDESTRMALEYALWTYGSELVSAETLYEHMWNAGWELIQVESERDGSAAEKADQRLHPLFVAREDIDAVRATPIGGVVELKTDASGVVAGLRDCHEVIDKDPLRDRASKPLSVLTVISGVRDAVTSLLGELEPVGSVAA